MNELIILYLLSKSYSTMYGLSKNIKKIFAGITKPGFGTLQPALKRLEKQEYIKSEKFFTDGGKPYFYYSLTAKGNDFLKEKLLEKLSDNPSQFYPTAKIKLACSDVLEDSEKIELYKSVKAKLLKLKSELENIMSSGSVDENYYQRMVLDNTICDYKNLLSLIEGFEHACCR